MILRPIPRSRLANVVPSLLDAQALVAVVPGTGDVRWAAAAAWELARAAVGEDRRVALVDLWVEQPTLHEVVGVPATEGIVDAFEYGVSLTKAAREIDRVFFIPTGSYTARAAELYGHARWPKLHAGFRAEAALLLLYLPPAALGRLSVVPDGVLVLSPDGVELESAVGREIVAGLERGAPLLGVVRERWTPAPAAQAPPLEPGPSRARRRVHPAAVALALVAVGAGAWTVFARNTERPEAPVVAAAPAPRPEMDSLPWTVQLAAYATLENALGHADELAAAGRGAFVTPVALDGSAAVWYRVLVGAYPTRDAAMLAREDLWRRGTAPHGQGDVLYAPYSYALADSGAVAPLRAHGIPAVRWEAGGTSRLLFGAFETPEQAAVAGKDLERAGLGATLITRTGTTP